MAVFKEVEFYRGEASKLPASRDSDAFYITTDTGKMYLGETRLGGGGLTHDSVQGEDSQAGCKGYYFTKIDNTNKKIALTANIPTTDPTVGTISDADKITLTTGYDVDDLFTIVNKNKYVRCGRITGIDNNIITFETLVPKYFATSEQKDPFEQIISVGSDRDTEDYSFTVPSKPQVGLHEIKTSAFAGGVDSISAGRAAFVFGRDNIAIGDFASVTGRDNEAGYNAHAEGRGNKAYGGFSHAEGRSNVVGDENAAVDMWLSQYSHAEGAYNHVKAKFAHAEGESNLVTGESAHAEGRINWAAGQRTHVEGSQTTAVGVGAHSEGTSSNAGKELFSGSMPDKNSIKDMRNNYGFSIAYGQASHVEGNNNCAYGKASHGEGNANTIDADYAHAEGDSNTVYGISAHSEGAYNYIAEAAKYGHVEGSSNIVNHLNGHAEGWETTVYNERGHTEGSRTSTAGVGAHSEGTSSVKAYVQLGDIITGSDLNTIKTKWESSGRYFSLAKGQGSHVQNNNCLALAKNSSAAGNRTIASAEDQFVVGRYNKEDSSALFIVGGGDASNPDNILSVGADSFKIRQHSGMAKKDVFKVHNNGEDVYMTLGAAQVSESEFSRLNIISFEEYTGTLDSLFSDLEDYFGSDILEYQNDSIKGVTYGPYLNDAISTSLVSLYNAAASNKVGALNFQFEMVTPVRVVTKNSDIFSAGGRDYATGPSYTVFLPWYEVKFSSSAQTYIGISIRIMKGTYTMSGTTHTAYFVELQHLGVY